MAWFNLTTPQLIRSQPFCAKMNFQELDPTQVALLKEPCIAVDENDKIIGSISKENAHILAPENQLPPLHRAFSVFLFNSSNQLLMQQRSFCKITFPGTISNFLKICSE